MRRIEDEIEKFSSDFIRAVAGDNFEAPVGPAILELARAITHLADVVQEALEAQK
jgi:hypothetical protein